MPKTLCKFSVSYNLDYPMCTMTNGILIHDRDLFDLVGRLTNSPLSTSTACIHIAEPEDSPILAKILQAIKDRYGFEPSQHRIRPAARREIEFGMPRVRTYTENELNNFEYLRILQVPKAINAKKIGCDEPSVWDKPLAAEQYRPKKSDSLGGLFLGPAVVVEAMKDQLLAAGVKGFSPAQKLGEVPLWRFGSNIILPRSLTPIQNADGEVVDPDDVSNLQINQQKHWDDGGYSPPELRYSRADLEAIGPFDIAMSYERCGNFLYDYFREIIVSQHLRQLLIKWGHKKIKYVPVRVID